MEYRDDLAGVLLSGLPTEERRHVVEVIAQEDAEKLQRKRAAVMRGSDELAAGEEMEDADEA